MTKNSDKQTWIRKVKSYLIFTLVGGIVYWGPYIVCRWVFGEHMIWFISITILVPLIVAYVYFFVWRKMKRLESPKIIAFFMLLGIWFFGPLGLAIGELPRGAILDVRGFLSLWAAFPLSTFMLATYNYSILSLMIATFILMIFAVVFKEKKKS
jgi:FtsH-binding integral membrane protein